MTRETKIGLLVGLAFIIVIGILLSDHLTSTNEPQQAALAQAGGNVRSAVTVPGASTSPLAVNNPAPQHVAPVQPVPTKEELTPRQPPVEIVQIGAATTPQHPSAAGARPDETQTLSAQQGVAGIDSNSTPTPRPLDVKATGALANVAKSMGEEVVPANSTVSRPQQPVATSTATSGKQYKVEPGDNLAKIAAKTLGSASKANIAAIIAANPSLQQNPNLIIAGRTYNIPAGGTAPIAATSSAPSAVATAQSTQSSAPQSSDAGSFYIVKPNDSLTKIAISQLGTASAVAAIKDLNQDVLKGSDVIQPNMKLRMPAKTVASAS